MNTIVSPAPWTATSSSAPLTWTRSIVGLITTSSPLRRAHGTGGRVLTSAGGRSVLGPTRPLQGLARVGWMPERVVWAACAALRPGGAGDHPGPVNDHTDES